MRSRAGMRVGAVLAVRIAYATMVMMLDSRRRSARIQTPNVEMNWTITEVATSRIRPITASVRRDRTAARITLPTETTSSSGIADQGEKVPATAAATARR